MQLRKEATSQDLYDSTLLVARAFPLENMKLGKLSLVDEVAYVWDRIQHIALLIMFLLTQSGKDCHLAYSQISFNNHTNRHVTSSDWRFTFLCPDLTSRKLSDSVTAHWVLFVVCQDTDANFKIRQRTRLRTCEWKKCCSVNYLFTIVHSKYGLHLRSRERSLLCQSLFQAFMDPVARDK